MSFKTCVQTIGKEYRNTSAIRKKTRIAWKANMEADKELRNYVGLTTDIYLAYLKKDKREALHTWATLYRQKKEAPGIGNIMRTALAEEIIKPAGEQLYEKSEKWTEKLNHQIFEASYQEKNIPKAVGLTNVNLLLNKARLKVTPNPSGYGWKASHISVILGILYEDLGNIRLNKGDEKGAIKAYMKSLDCNSTNWRASEKLGDLLRDIAIKNGEQGGKPNFDASIEAYKLGMKEAKNLAQINDNKHEDGTNRWYAVQDWIDYSRMAIKRADILEAKKDYKGILNSIEEIGKVIAVLEPLLGRIKELPPFYSSKDMDAKEQAKLLNDVVGLLLASYHKLGDATLYLAKQQELNDLIEAYYNGAAKDYSKAREIADEYKVGTYKGNRAVEFFYRKEIATGREFVMALENQTKIDNAKAALYFPEARV